MVARGTGYLQQDAPHLPVIGAAAAVEDYPALAALEQRRTQEPLEHPDAVGDGGGAHAYFLGRANETLVTPRGLEMAQAIEWRQCVQGIGDRWLNRALSE